MSHTSKGKLLKNYHPLKFNSSPLKNDGWKGTFLLGKWSLFRGVFSWTSDRYLVWGKVTSKFHQVSGAHFRGLVRQLSQVQGTGFSAKNPRPWNQIPPLDVSFIRVCRFITWNDPKKMGEPRNHHQGAIPTCPFLGARFSHVTFGSYGGPRSFTSFGFLSNSTMKKWNMTRLTIKGVFQKTLICSAIPRMALFQIMNNSNKYSTLQGANISHLGKKKTHLQHSDWMSG